MKTVIDALFEEDFYRIVKVETQDLKKTDFWRKKAVAGTKLLSSFTEEERDLFGAYLIFEEKVQEYFAKKLYTLAFKKGFAFALELGDKPDKPNPTPKGE